MYQGSGGRKGGRGLSSHRGPLRVGDLRLTSKAVEGVGFSEKGTVGSEMLPAKISPPGECQYSVPLTFEKRGKNFDSYPWEHQIPV